MGSQRKIEYEIILETGQAEKRIHDLGEELDENGRKMQNSGDKTSSLGGAFADLAGKTAAAAGGLRAVVQLVDEVNKVMKEGEDRSVAFGSRLAKFAAERGGINKARSEVRDLTVGTGLTMDEAATMLDEAGDLGFKGQDAMEAARFSALAGNVLGMGDSKQILEVGGQIAKSQGIDFGKALGKVRAVGERAMAANLSTLLQQAEAAGIDQDQALAFVGSLSDSGQGTRAAGANATAFISQLSSTGYKGGDLREGMEYLKRRGSPIVGKVSAGFDSFDEVLSRVKNAGSGHVLGDSYKTIAGDSSLQDILAVNTAKQEADYLKQRGASTGRAVRRAELEREVSGSNIIVQGAYRTIDAIPGANSILEDQGEREMGHRSHQDTKLLNDIRDNTRRPQSNPTAVPRSE